MFDALGVHWFLGYAAEVSIERIVEAYHSLAADPAGWQQRSQRGMELVDGQGAARIVEAILSEVS